jgi:hypothetical protein
MKIFKNPLNPFIFWFIILVCVSTGFAQNFDWIKSSGYFAEGKSIAMDDEGYLYATGHFAGDVQFGDYVFSSVSNNPDIYLVKYDSLGNCIWAKTVTGTLYKSCFEVAVDGNGDIYITGMYDGTLLLEDISLTTSGFFDIFLAKYNSNGEILWAESAGGSYLMDHPMALAFDSNENVIITGSFEHTASFGDITVSSGVVSGGNPNVEWGGEAFVAKYTTLGEIVWIKHFPGSHHINRGHSIVVDSEDNIYLTGKYEGDLYLENDTLNSLGSFDIFTLRLDNDGNVIWANSSGGFQDDKPTPAASAIDENDNYYFTGYFREDIYFNGQQLTSNGDIDTYLAKYNPEGELLWIKSEGGTQAERVYGLTQHNNLLYATGYMYGNSVFNDEVELTSFGGRDIFISCYNTNGDFYWAENHGSPSDDWAFEILHDEINSVYITGFHNNNAVYGDTTLSANQYRNLFIGKFTDENSCVTIKENLHSNTILYPNPTSGDLYFELENIVEVRILDVFGNCAKHVLNPQTKSINLTGLQSGTYIVKLRDTSGNQIINKILKKNQ